MIICQTLTVSYNVSAQDDVTNEYTLKALFVYNFTKHMEWPANSSSNSKFQLVIVGKNEITNSLTKLLGGRKVNDKLIEVKTVSNTSKIEPAQIIFIPRGSYSKVSNQLESLSAQGTLIITEEKSITDKYSDINIVEKDNGLRFEINEINLRKAGFKVSNQLLQLSISSK
jgi:hypothetical protein